MTTINDKVADIQRTEGLERQAAKGCSLNGILPATAGSLHLILTFLTVLTALRC